MTPKAKKENDRAVYNSNLLRAWKSKQVCLHCLFETKKGGAHWEHALKYGFELTPYKDKCWEVVDPDKKEAPPAESVNPAWGNESVMAGKMSDAPVKKQTPQELFNEMEKLFAPEVMTLRSETIAEYGYLIDGLVDVFNRNLEFALGGSSGGRARKIHDTKAQQFLSNLENMIRELGHHVAQHFPNLPAKKYIIFREVRSKVDISGLAFMDKNIQAVAEMIEFKLRKQLEYMYEQQ